jgi:ATP-dependent Clp protease ATP-binding subunit ClpB
VRRRPYSVVLLDEIEKAHRDVFNILLQVLDDGRLTDNHGHTVDFTNTIVVMTSNIGSQMIQEIAREGGTQQEMKDALEEALKTRFLPEFLNRIDEVIVFHPLDRSHVTRIVDLQLKRLEQMLAKRGLKLVVTKAAKAQIAALGYDPAFGARPVKRVIQQSIQNPLASELLRGEYPEGTTVEVDFEGDEFTFRRRDGESADEPIDVEFEVQR